MDLFTEALRVPSLSLSATPSWSIWNAVRIMVAGNKKKKKPAANPARGFATTSVQSKSRQETVDEDSKNVSGDGTPSTPTSNPAVTKDDQAAPSVANAKRELHELSPEELEAQLETSDLQNFVEKHAAKVRKEASRHVSRLQTEKRLLRGQADFLSVRDWLPEELLQQILDFSSADLKHETQSRNGRGLPQEEELVAKVWNLSLTLKDLEVPQERVREAVRFVLQSPPNDASTGQLWGLMEALDWLAAQCEAGELLEYDLERKPAIANSAAESADISDESPEDIPALPDKKHDSPLSDSNRDENSTREGEALHVSDIDSDLEPDELLSVHLQMKTRLYGLDPFGDNGHSKQAGRRVNGNNGDHTGKHQSAGARKLRQNLRKIESDLLFDQHAADEAWAAKKIELIREAADREKLQISKEVSPTRKKSDLHGSNGRPDDVVESAEKLGRDLIHETDELEGDDMLSGMFNALPGVSEEPTIGSNAEVASHNVTVRDFGKLTGIAPRRVLEETCRSRDPKCKVSCRQVSATTYACRHSTTINWSKEQEVVESSFLPTISVKSTAGHLTVTMMEEATPDAQQSEAYVVTAALFLISSGSPKEEKAHMRLPPGYRDLWNEFLNLKREWIDDADRQTVRDLRHLVEEEAKVDEEVDDEVVFNASSRRLNGVVSGTSTPVSRPLTPKSGPADVSHSLREIWARKIAAPSYQRMLLARMNLPMFHAKAAMLDAIARNQITIIQGDTGSGKSTQLPQFILEHEHSNGRPCKIYCTQPRRISAISLAQRVSEELGESRGDLGTMRSLVGYAIRLESQATSQTKLVYATVGIVLRMLESSDGLNEITHLVLDEVHERSIDTDFLLIVLQSLLVKRPDLKVVLMSATVDAQKFSQYLNHAPIISVPGRTFPVQSKFLEDAIELTGHTNDDASTRNDDSDEIESDQVGKGGAPKPLEGYSKQTKNTLASYNEYRIDHVLIVKLLEKIAYHPEYQRFSKAILVFLPGIAEIRQLNDMVLGHPSFAQGWRIHALHSTFSSEDQQAAFDIPPDGMRKIVLSTNIAETGITIPDVTCVIDTGKHREMRYDERRQMSRLIQSFIARANAKQRRGRAGRVQEGLCFHLFSKYRFEELMMEQQTPEMLRLSLQDLVMRVKICKLGDIEGALSQALDPPSSKNIRRAIDALIEVGALTDSEQLTSLGSQLAKLPLDAQLGKLLLFGASFGCLDVALTVAAALSSKSPFLSPMHAKKQADSVRLGFKRGDSDLLTLYNAYSTWRKVCTTPGLNEFQFCNKNFLSPQNLANIEDLKGQLLSSVADAGFVNLGAHAHSAPVRARPGARQRNFVELPSKYCRADENDLVASSVVAWSFYPKIVKQEGKGWRNIANNQSLGLHPTSVNKTTMSPDVAYLSFYSIMQSSSRFTNAQETTPTSDFALVLLAGDAVFHMYAGVIVIDGNRLRFKVKDWKTMIALKILRMKIKEALGRSFKYPGKDLGDRQRRWMELLERMFQQRSSQKM